LMPNSGHSKQVTVDTQFGVADGRCGLFARMQNWRG
jgi:hypothetical protein